MNRIYLDYAAASPVDERVKIAMDEYLAKGNANPSGLYREAAASKKVLEDSRRTVAGFIGAKASKIFFTASTTESNNLAILGAARANSSSGRHLITTATEHVSVLNPFKQLEREGFEFCYLPVDEFGRVSAEQASQATRADTILVSIIFANNEIGTINPIREIGRAIKEVKRYKRDEKGRNGLPYFHTDAAQAAPHLKISVNDLDLDLMSFSSSKLYGPKGAAALFVKTGVKIEPVMFGGAQENGLRPGTQDVAGIVGFAKAVEITGSESVGEDKRLKELRDKIIREIKLAVPDALLNGHPAERLANNISFSFPGVAAEELVMAMDEAGFALSTRSACDAKNAAPPHVVKALGRTDKEAWGAIRITLGRQTTIEEIDRFVDI